MNYKRVLLKISGEALAGDQGFGINPIVVKDIAQQIKDAKDLGVEIAIVCGAVISGEVRLVLIWVWKEQVQITWVCSQLL